MAPYYACLEAHTRCDEGELVLEIEDCRPPLLLLARDAGAPVEADGAALRSVEEGHR
jgi:hypothetical protein